MRFGVLENSKIWIKKPALASGTVMGAIITHPAHWGKITPMFPTKKLFFFNLLLLALFIPAVVISGCAKKPSQRQPTPVAVQPTSLPTPLPAVDRVVLVAPANFDPVLLADAESVLRELAASSALEFERREQVAVNEITSDIKVMVFLNQPENLGSLASGAPGTQFVAIMDQDWNPGQNVTVIRRREDHIAFMAGYLAALLAPNYRVGTLLPVENPVFSQAFVNGASYYCGPCASLLIPLNKYPFVSTQPAASPASAWQAGFDAMNVNKINVLFVAKEAASPELLAYLATLDVAMIGSKSPPAEGKPKWVATIYSDGITPIREIWPDLMAGKGGKVLNAALKIFDNQYVTVGDGLVWLSQGKMDFAQKTMDLLQDNYINPLPVS